MKLSSEVLLHDKWVMYEVDRDMVIFSFSTMADPER